MLSISTTHLSLGTKQEGLLLFVTCFISVKSRWILLSVNTKIQVEPGPREWTVSSQYNAGVKCKDYVAPGVNCVMFYPRCGLCYILPQVWTVLYFTSVDCVTFYPRCGLCNVLP